MRNQSPKILKVYFWRKNLLPTKDVMNSRKSLIPVYIFSKANYNDSDGGILFGRWTETYPKNCTPPTAWTGSTAILEKFWKKKFYVKYGQCWVFSGLVTTCKSLNKRKCVRTVSNRRKFQYVSIAFMIYIHHLTSLIAFFSAAIPGLTNS